MCMYIQCIYNYNFIDRCLTGKWIIMAKKDGTKSTKKDSQLVLRLDKSDRDAFVDLCKELDTSAAREIRRFIKDFMNEHGTT